MSIGVVILFFALVLNDLPRSYHVYYDMFFLYGGITVCLDVYSPVIDYAGRVTEDKVQEWALNVLMIGAGKKAACIADDLYGLGYNIVGFSPMVWRKGGSPEIV